MLRVPFNRYFLLTFCFIFITNMFAQKALAQEAKHPNILFIAVDDLKTNFNAYGNSIVKSPELDKLAASGTLFYNNHCQQAVCGATRASLLTGWMPQFTNIDIFYKPFRNMYPEVVTLPQFFRENGYRVEGMGKIYDPRNTAIGDPIDSKHSWDVYYTTGGKGKISEGRDATECADVPDSAYRDGSMAIKAVERLNALKESDQPFFLAVGFYKPHLAFNAPKKYWDLYDREKLSVAAYQEHAKNDKDFCYNIGSELRNGYTADGLTKQEDLPIDLQLELIHGYYACVSFIDAQVGKLVQALKENGQYDNTIIVLWGDHGWHLGDHGQWCKHTNFEQATRSPLIIRAPGSPRNIVTKSPSAHVDIYPTLCDLAGFEVPEILHGKSLKPIVEGKTEKVQDFVVSHYPKGGHYGDALRNERYRYVEWRQGGLVKHTQLFDYYTDSLETVNIASLPENESLVESLSTQLNDYLDQFRYPDNYGFENLQEHTTFPEGWTSESAYRRGDGYVTGDADNARSGDYCLKMEAVKATKMNDFGCRMLNPITLSGKNPLSMSLYAKVKGGAEGKIVVNMTFHYINSDKQTVSSQVFTLNDQYQKLEQQFTPPKSPSGEWPVHAEFEIRAGEILTTYYIDDVEFRQTDL